MHEAAAYTRQSQALYEQYVKPLENERRGEFVAVSPDGRLLLATTLIELMESAAQQLGPGNFLNRIGDIALDTWR